MTIETLTNRYKEGRISLEMLKVYVKKGVISVEDYEAITDKVYV